MELAESLPNAWVPHQFNNMANPEIHRKTTAKEILKDFPKGFDYLITGVGTGGHITGVGQVLKAEFPKLEVYAVEPEDSPVRSEEHTRLNSSHVAISYAVFCLKKKNTY